jgi:hypothetical protein
VRAAVQPDMRVIADAADGEKAVSLFGTLRQWTLEMLTVILLLALDRNVRVLSPIEMSVYRREAVCREGLCVCPESESSRRDELLSDTARYGGVVPKFSVMSCTAF